MGEEVKMIAHRPGRTRQLRLLLHLVLLLLLLLLSLRGLTSRLRLADCIMIVVSRRQFVEVLAAHGHQLLLSARKFAVGCCADDDGVLVDDHGCASGVGNSDRDC